MLIVPCLDYRHETPSSFEVTDERVWHRTVSKAAWEAYLKDVSHSVPIYAAPAIAEELTNLPPAFISVEGNDLLRDEDVAYAQKLMQHGVDVELHVYPGAYHGSFLMAPEADVSKRHKRDIMNWLGRIMRGSRNIE